jgi:hypothetical protein
MSVPKRILSINPLSPESKTSKNPLRL